MKIVMTNRRPIKNEMINYVFDQSLIDRTGALILVCQNLRSDKGIVSQVAILAISAFKDNASSEGVGYIKLSGEPYQYNHRTAE